MTDSILTEMYRAQRAQESGSAVYRPTAEKPKAANLYADSPVYGGLGSYSREVADPLAKKPLESQTNWELRTAARRRMAEQAAQAEADAQAWSEHRQQVDNQVSTRSVFGNELTSRSAIISGRGFSEPGRQGQAMGHIRPESLAAKTPLSAADVNMIIKQREAERLGQQPVRTEVQSRSSGSGWLGVDTR